MRHRLSICVAFTLVVLPVAAQTPDARDHFANTDARRAALEAAKEGIKGDSKWDYFTTADLIVLFEASSERKGDRDAALRDALRTESQWDRWFQAARVFLPPEADTADLFHVVTIPQRVVDTRGSNGSQPSVRVEVEGAPIWNDFLYLAPEVAWNAYARAWFGDRHPEFWFTTLAEASMIAGSAVEVSTDAILKRLTGPARASAQDEKDGWRRTMKNITKVPKSGFEGLSSRLESEFGFRATFGGEDMSAGDRTRRVRAIESRPALAWGAFLGKGPKQLGAKFKPEWKAWLIDYARAVKAGTDPAEARAVALRSITAKEFETALAKWASTAK